MKTSFPDRERQAGAGKKPAFAVIFDMDGVLVDSNPAHKIALRRFCRQHGHHLSEDYLRAHIYGRTNRDWLTRLFGEALSAAQIAVYEAEKEALYREIFAGDIRPLPGLLPFLQRLQSAGIPLAIATSAPPENVTFTLQKTGTAGFFPVILDATFISHSKPHPEIYLKTAAALGFVPRRCAVFEDSLSGVAAARAAGCRVVGVTTTHAAAEFSGVERVIENFNGMDISDLKNIFTD